MNTDTEQDLQAPLTEAEPPEWHVYRALVIYRDAHKGDCDNIYYKRKLDLAHEAYLNTFVAG